jgi:hypothetical protein
VKKYTASCEIPFALKQSPSSVKLLRTVTKRDKEPSPVPLSLKEKGRTKAVNFGKGVHPMPLTADSVRLFHRIFL